VRGLKAPAHARKAHHDPRRGVVGRERFGEVADVAGEGESMTTWKAPTGFAASHCMNCKAGWTRSKEDSALIICLLDRQPIPPNLTACDRYEAKDE
jgi:hypothetical protein